MELYSNRTSTENLEEKPPTPGLKYRHYSPNAPVLLYEGDNSEAMQVAIIKVVEERINAGESVGLIHTRPNSIKLPDSWLNNNLLHIATLGEEKGFLPVAQGLFASLRELDAKGVAVIVMEGVPEREEGVAIMNRARKAASTVTSV
jgi:L-threonylcarbamoyladenylate synthase